MICAKQGKAEESKAWKPDLRKRVPDLEFVKKFTRPNFRAKEFYTLKMRQLRLFLPAINSENASFSVI